MKYLLFIAIISSTPLINAQQFIQRIGIANPHQIEIDFSPQVFEWSSGIGVNYQHERIYFGLTWNALSTNQGVDFTFDHRYFFSNLDRRVKLFGQLAAGYIRNTSSYSDVWTFNGPTGHITQNHFGDDYSHESIFHEINFGGGIGAEVELFPSIMLWTSVLLIEELHKDKFRNKFFTDPEVEYYGNRDYFNITTKLQIGLRYRFGKASA